MFLAAGCSETSRYDSNLSQIYLETDTTSFQQLLQEDHAAVRRALNNSIYDYLKEKSESRKECHQKLNWLTGLYHQETGLSDLSKKSFLFSGWSPAQIRQKLALDSIFSQLTSEPMDEDDCIDSLFFLKDQYLVLADTFFAALINFEIGKLQYEMDQVDSSKKYLDNAIYLAEKVDLMDIIGLAELLRAKIYQIYRGEYYAAERSILNSIACFDRIDSRYYRSVVLAYQGYFYNQLNQTGRAIRSFGKLLSEYKVANHLKGVADCQYYLAESFYDIGDLDSALYYGTQSLAIRSSMAMNKIELLSDAAYAASCLALVYQGKGEFSIADSLYNHAESLFCKSNDSVGISLNSLRKASGFLERKEFRRAEGLFETILKGTNRFEENIYSMYGLALSQFYLNNHTKAKKTLLAATKSLEMAWRNLPVPDIKTGIIADKSGIFKLLVHLYIREYLRDSNKLTLDSALYYREKGRANSLIESILETRNQDVSNKEAEFFEKITALQKKMIFNSESDEYLEQISKLEDSLLSIRFFEEKVIDDFDAKADNFSFSNLSNRLNEREVILDYSISEFGSYCFIITCNGLELFDIGVLSDSITSLAENYLSYIGVFPENSVLSPKAAEIGKRLYEILIPDVLVQSGDRKNLIILPSESISNLPFETLVAPDDSFLVHKYVISYWPSLRMPTHLSPDRKTANRGNVHTAAFGNPVFGHFADEKENLSQILFLEWGLSPLGSAETELHYVCMAMEPNRVSLFSGGNATESNFKRLEFNEYSYIHLATHGLADYANPERSAIVFSMGENIDESNDGILRADEIRRLEMSGNTVFLSACNTGSGKVVLGEGILNLARQFLIAGCSGAIASYWQVDDNSSAQLVLDFYRGINAGNSSSEALVLAKRKSIESGFSHPYFWAPFVFIGIDD